jgi:hypothetical protein
MNKPYNKYFSSVVMIYPPLVLYTLFPRILIRRYGQKNRTSPEASKMTAEITVYYDEQGHPMGISGRAQNKAQFKEQMQRLRTLGVL